jgi:excisionase family DNA binding protein
VINGRGLIYTVEEVSEMLGIPRPTLYRYLREYSIPHLRKSGKISIPEESFDRIREARDLHKEGLGTESVRRALREGSNGPDTGEIKAQIDRLSESLERLRGNGSAADEALSSQAMRTVLARQSLLMSAMFNLTEMMEELLLASGKRRKTVFEEVEGEIREVSVPRRGGRLRGRRSAPSGATPRELPGRSSAIPATRAERFGTLARRRRRTSLALLSALLVCVALLLVLPRLGGGEQPLAGLPFLGDRAGESPSTPNEAPEKHRDSGTASGSVATAQSPSEGDETQGAGASGGVVQTGPGEVPDVSGRDVEEAARRLSRAGYEVAAIQTVNSEEEAGTVLRTQPAVGTKAEPGTPVFLVMSGGPTGRSE